MTSNTPECPFGHGPLVDGKCQHSNMYHVCHYQRDPHGDHYIVVSDEIDLVTGVNEWELIHPDGCKPTFEDLGGLTCYSYPCDAFYAVCEGWIMEGLEELTQPGKYRIEVWSAKNWTDYGWEPDEGVLLIGDSED